MPDKGAEYRAGTRVHDMRTSKKGAGRGGKRSSSTQKKAKGAGRQTRAQRAGVIAHNVVKATEMAAEGTGQRMKKALRSSMVTDAGKRLVGGGKKMKRASTVQRVKPKTGMTRRQTEMKEKK